MATPKQDTHMVVFASAKYPGSPDGRPYHLESIDGHCPPGRWFATYHDLVWAIVQANPGTSIREA
jgi:hypothetical protein